MDKLFDCLITDDPSTINLLMESEEDEYDDDFDDVDERKERLRKIRNILILAAGAIALIKFVKSKIDDANKKKLFEKNTQKLEQVLIQEKDRLVKNRNAYKKMSKDRKHLSRKERKECKALAAKIDNQMIYIDSMQLRVKKISENYCKANHLNILNTSNMLMSKYLSQGDKDYRRFEVYQSWKDYKQSTKPPKQKKPKRKKKIKIKVNAGKW